MLGVDGHSLSKRQLRELLSPRAYYELKHGRYVHEGLSSPGAIGCYLAHVKAWKRVMKENIPMAIFEDDFVAKDGSKEILLKVYQNLPPFDILRLQHRSNPDINEILEPKGDLLVKVNRTEGLTAYILTPLAAKKLLATAFPINCQVDHYLDFSSYYHGLSSLSLKESLFDDPQVRSIIQHNSIKKYNPIPTYIVIGLVILSVIFGVITGFYLRQKIS